MSGEVTGRYAALGAYTANRAPHWSRTVQTAVLLVRAVENPLCTRRLMCTLHANQYFTPDFTRTVLWLTLELNVLWLTLELNVLWLTLELNVLWLTLELNVLWLNLELNVLWLTLELNVLWLTLELNLMTCCQNYSYRLHGNIVLVPLSRS